MRYALLFSVFFCASCSQYDWSPDELFTGQGTAPVVAFAADLTLGDSDNVDQPYVLPVNISDPDTAFGQLNVQWSGSVSDPAPVSIVQQGQQFVALFPRNGTYQLTVQVSDGRDRSQDSIIVIVNVSQEFSVKGSVQDNAAANQGINAELRFANGFLIETSGTDGSGVFQFNNLIGALSNYEVIVP